MNMEKWNKMVIGRKLALSDKVDIAEVTKATREELLVRCGVDIYKLIHLINDKRHLV